MKMRATIWLSAILVGLLLVAADVTGPGSHGPAGAAAQGQALLVDSDFEANENGQALRSREDPQGWYESRRDGKEGRLLLKLSTKKVGGNATHKAMIKASPEFNTYVSQALSSSQTGSLALQWDLYVKEILPPFNRSAFQMLGDSSVKGRGPNGNGAERFVFLGFMNAEQEGKMNLFALEGYAVDEGAGRGWDDRTVLIEGLDLKHWYTVRVDVNIAEGFYEVSLPGVHDTPIRVKAYKTKKSPIPEEVTHVSFASWNDGPGTFYVDNVRQP